MFRMNDADCSTSDLIGEGRDGADCGAEARGDAEQGLEAGIALTPLDSADQGEVFAGPFGELLLTLPRLEAKPPHRLAQRRVLRRAGLPASLRRHAPASRLENPAVRPFMP